MAELVTELDDGIRFMLPLTIAPHYIPNTLNVDKDKQSAQVYGEIDYPFPIYPLYLPSLTSVNI